jgi:hypothetical protein
MKEMFIELSESRLEVVLAQSDETIYFTRTHIADLKSALGAEEDGGSESAKASSG